MEGTGYIGPWTIRWVVDRRLDGGVGVVVVGVVATARSPVSTAAILAQDTLRALFCLSVGDR